MMDLQKLVEQIPLPEPAMEDVPYEAWGQNMVYPALYSVEQVRAVILASMQYAAEEAAKVCEKTDADGEHHEWYGWGAADYAQAIRERFKAL